MPMLACIHHVSWLKAIEGGLHLCTYCRKVLTKKDLYPKFEELGADFQANWDRHERGEASPVPELEPHGGLTAS